MVAAARADVAAATPAASRAAAGDTAQAAAACQIALDARGRVTVDGVATEVRAEPSVAAEVAAWPLPEAGAVAVAVGAPIAPPVRYAPGGILWRITCDTPGEPAVTELLREEGADFVHAVPSGDGRGLWYSRADGLGLVNLVSRKTERVDKAPVIDPACAEAFELPPTTRLRDFPRRLDPEGLTLWRGGPCGLEGDWAFDELVLEEPDEPMRRGLRRPHPVAALAADEAGVLWLADGACERVPTTRGALWRSDDSGERWVRVPVLAAGAVMAHGGAALVADGRQPGHLAVLSRVCRSPRVVAGGDLLFTEDGGATWRRAEAPPGEPGVAYGFGLSALWSPTGRLDDLRAARPSAGDGPDQVFASADRGRSWRPVAEAAPPPIRPGSLEVDGQRYEADRFGLTRQAATGGEATRVFPPEGWDARANPPATRRARDLVDRAEVTWEQVDAAHELLAACRRHAAERRPGAALAACAEAWRVDPNEADARYEAARVEVGRGDLTRARALLTELRRLGGFQALTILAGAPADPTLRPVAAAPWFEALTAVEGPGPAFVTAASPDHPAAIDLFIGSDRHERLCTWYLGPDGGGGPQAPLAFSRVDCATGLEVDPVRLPDPAAADAWLQRHGVVAWARVDDARLRSRAATWLARRLDPAPSPGAVEAALTLLRSPSGRRVALLAGHGGGAARVVADAQEVLGR
ncbi:MAG: hypothetical protein CSA66_00510 [Proteobacteria bacterium]|nr:MAG: hypothetical protein CSA66_00510 [Pseudomonadota bacterium]